MQIVAKEKSLGISTTRNLDTTVILHHAKHIAQKIEFLQKCSLDNFASAFDMSCDLNEIVMLTNRLSKLYHTIVAKMLQ